MPAPTFALSNLEYLALKMSAHPGESGRFYRRALCKYKYPIASKTLVSLGRGDHYSQYFRRNCPYRGKLWIDVAPKTAFDPAPFLSERGGRYERRKPRVSDWRLTEEGHRLASQARSKLGI